MKWSWTIVSAQLSSDTAPFTSGSDWGFNIEAIDHWMISQQLKPGD
jgi:hypothetical protein